MNRIKKYTWGVLLIGAGCMWLVLDLIWLPPLTIVVGWIIGWPDSLDRFYRRLFKTEPVMALAVLLFGVYLYRRNRLNN